MMRPPSTNGLIDRPLIVVSGLFALVGAILALLGILDTSRAQTTDGGGHDQVVMSKVLSNSPGASMTAIVVDYGPGGRSPAHHHAGSVFAYVLQGEIRSQNSATGPEKVYHAGECFFEPPGSIHLVSENASATTPARLLAVFVAPTNAQLTTPELPKETIPQ
jgi:quercetin dioxygenase-like cupin family protein